MGNSQNSFRIIHPHAAGIDVGSHSHLVAIDQNKSDGRSRQCARIWGVPNDHLQLIDHLRRHRITTIAMESTGSYWQTLFNVLQQAGFDVLLAGGSQTKNVKAGRRVPPQNRRDRLHLDSKAALAGLTFGQSAYE